MLYMGAISKITELSMFISKANHSISQYSKSMPQPLMPKKLICTQIRIPIMISLKNMGRSNIEAANET